jgi:hypothetical protein
MKKTMYNLFFLTILFHIFLDASNDQANALAYEEAVRLQTKNEEIWPSITDAVLSHPKFPKILSCDPKIHFIINHYFENIGTKKLPGVGGKKRNPLKDNLLNDRRAFDAATQHMTKEIIKNIKLYALSLHRQKTEKHTPTPEELAQADEEFLRRAQKADQVMQALLAAEAAQKAAALDNKAGKQRSNKKNKKKK